MPNGKTPRSRPSPVPVAGEGPSPTGKVLLAGAAVVGGVLLLSMVQQRGGWRQMLGLPAAPTAPGVARPPTAALPGPVPVPTEPGLTFRSGSFGGFIPIPFDRIVSSIFSVFQPSRSEAAQITTPGPVEAPIPEQYETLPETYVAETIPLYDSEGVLLRPSEDQFLAGAEYYEEGPIPAEVTEPITGEVVWTEQEGEWSEPLGAYEWMV